MKIRTFLKQFKEIADKFYWKVLPNSCLRGHFRGSNLRRDYCPITAVTRIKFNKYISVGCVDKAQDLLKMEASEASAIIDAADYKVQDADRPQLRKSLLRATRAKGAEI